jgi:hypothetical protein
MSLYDSLYNEIARIVKADPTLSVAIDTTNSEWLKWLLPPSDPSGYPCIRLDGADSTNDKLGTVKLNLNYWSTDFSSAFNDQAEALRIAINGSRVFYSIGYLLRPEYDNNRNRAMFPITFALGQ